MAVCVAAQQVEVEETWGKELQDSLSPGAYNQAVAYPSAALHPGAKYFDSQWRRDSETLPGEAKGRAVPT